MFSTRGYVFVALNAIRAFSLITLLLVLISNILTIVSDVKAVNAFQARGGVNAIADNSTDPALGCGYIDGSTVPNQAAGVFWAVLNRLLIIFECIVLMLSEIGFPMKFFDVYFPVLGSKFGVGALGIFQCLIGASVLSHRVDTFALVAAFFVVTAGCINILVGLIFRARSKSKRALNPTKNDLLPSSIKSNIKPLMAGNFPEGFTNVTHSTYSNSSSSEKGSLPSYGSQAGSAFGRAAEKVSPFLAKSINIAIPEEAHPHTAPRVTFNSRPHPSFESSPNAV